MLLPAMIGYARGTVHRTRDGILTFNLIPANGRTRAVEIPSRGPFGTLQKWCSHRSVYEREGDLRSTL
ncbi:hypothetical protein TELCIR_18919 [Teladorsagia circumcincta]|uniref:Uncharacterized protein n=1 Tax=Teladorsagia circumcincta TaxID=45464 RepID=A0A2G9TNQ0_TELCI|nr:hypothetical protein TELCIR_18919 [Teladorsagia circumcincta]